MTARNDVTGDLIKSRILTKEGRDNWDKAFVKKSAHDWLKGEVVELLNDNGWQRGDGVSLDTPISYKEFCQRISISTVCYKGDFV